MGKDEITRFLLLVILCLIAGFSLLFGIGFWKTQWQFKNEVELADFINMIVTIACAIGAAWFVAKKLSEDRFNKEMVINDLKKIEEQVNRAIDLLMKEQTLSEAQRTEVLSINSYINVLLNRFVVIHSVGEDIDSLKQSFYEFYRCSTNFEDQNSFDVQSVIYQGNLLIKAVRAHIVKINER